MFTDSEIDPQAINSEAFNVPYFSKQNYQTKSRIQQIDKDSIGSVMNNPALHFNLDGKTV